MSCLSNGFTIAQGIASLLIPRKILGPVRCHPIRPNIGRPYYRADTSIQTLCLLEDSLISGDSEGGSTPVRWWIRSYWIRTAGRMEFEVAILETEPSPLDQQIAPKALHLRHLKMSLSCIVRKLGVDDKTVAKSIRRAWILAVKKSCDKRRTAPCSPYRDLSEQIRGGKTIEAENR